MNYTVFGGKGFIGSEVVRQLHKDGVEIFVPEKNDNIVFDRELGTVIYCAGFGDCKNDPFKVLDSNVTLLNSLLRKSKFEKLIYISSTRLYMNQISSSENSNLTVTINDERRLFNLTKLTAEELCLRSNRNISIVRPSNVYGLALNSPLFLPAITRDAINKGLVNMYVSPRYSKDYVSVLDVAEIIIKISKKEQLNREVYNIASGVNTSAGQIADILTAETGCDVHWHRIYDEEEFPVTSIQKIKDEFNFSPRCVLSDLKSMIIDFKKVL